MNRKRLLYSALLLLVLLNSSLILAQEPLDIGCMAQFYNHWSDAVYDATARGDYVYLACGSEGLIIADISNGMPLTEIADLDCGYATAITIENNFAYVGCNDGLVVYDISDLITPEEVARAVHDFTYVSAIKIVGDHIFICSANLGFVIFNKSDLQLVWNTQDFYVSGIDIIGDRAFLACLWQGLKVLDISNISSPQIVATYALDGYNYATGVAIRDNYAYLAYGDAGFRVVDLNLMQEVAAIDTLRYAYAVKVLDDFAYLSYGSPECPLAIVDISNPSAPQITGIYDPPEDIRSFDIVGNTACIADNAHGYRSVDISDKYNPEETFYYNKYGHDYDVSISGHKAIVKDDYYVRVVDISNPYQPVMEGAYEFDWEYSSLTVDGNTVFALQVAAGLLHVLDISAPGSPTLISTYDSQGGSHLAVDGNYGYLTSYDGIEVIDISDLDDIQHVSHLELNASGVGGAAISGDYLFTSTNWHDVAAIDICDPQSLHVVAQAGIGEFPVQFKADGSYLYVVTSYRLLIYRISDFQQWEPITTINVINGNSYYSLTGIDVRGNRAYITGDSLGLAVYDISDRLVPARLGRYDTPGYAHGVVVSGDIAVVADFNNVGIYDCADADDIQPIAIIPQDFAMAQNYPNPFNAQTIISFTLPNDAEIDLTVYDMMGRKVESLFEGPATVGAHQVVWDANHYSSGIYLYRLTSSTGLSASGRMNLLK